MNYVNNHMIEDLQKEYFSDEDIRRFKQVLREEPACGGEIVRGFGSILT